MNDSVIGNSEAGGQVSTGLNLQGENKELEILVEYKKKPMGDSSTW